MSDRFFIPILFIIFNRLETTKRVFEAIKEVKPTRLFVAADGYRPGIEGEKEKCEEVKKYILNNIDWGCEVKTLFRDKNLGCGKGPSEAITWFFENVEEGIILEDDCLPDQSFFYFCEELLARYKNDERIYIISGDNFIPKSFDRVDSSYYFSNIPHIWGWATWRRAWNKFSFKINDFPEFVSHKRINDIWNYSKVKSFWLNRFQESYKNDLDVWDYQWVYAIWKNKGVCIAPNCNLVSNIGFNSEGTHTLFNFNKLQNIPSVEIQFPLIHPEHITINKKMDDFINRKVFLKGYNLKLILKKLGLFDFIKKVYIIARSRFN